MIRVWIADDHTLFAQGLSRALDNLPDIRVVGIAASGSELLKQIGSQPAEVVITDLEMPGGGGSAVLEGIEDTPVIVVTMHASDEQRKAAARAGAAGFFSKSAPLTTIAAAIRAVAAGERFDLESEEGNEELLGARSHSSPRADANRAGEEILKYLAKGVSPPTSSPSSVHLPEDGGTWRPSSRSWRSATAGDHRGDPSLADDED